MRARRCYFRVAVYDASVSLLVFSRCFPRSEEVSKVESDLIRKYGLTLFVRKESEGEEDIESDEEEQLPDELNPDKHRPVLKTLEELEPILRERPFDLNWLVSRVEKVVQELNAEVKGGKAVLYQLGYRLPVDAGATPPRHRRLRYQTTPQSRRAELSSLKRGRDALRDDHGEDPLEESRELAEKAKRALQSEKAETGRKDEDDDDNFIAGGGGDGTPSKESPKKGKEFYEEKKTKAQLEFSGGESEDEEDDGSARKRAKLSKVPAPPKATPARDGEDGARRGKKGGNSYYFGPPPDDGIFNAYGNVCMRHYWSEQETNCIISALKSDPHLVGKWVTIKIMYGHILRNRTTIQIKDKYRNMLKRGDLDFLKTAEPEHEKPDDGEVVEEKV